MLSIKYSRHQRIETSQMKANNRTDSNKLMQQNSADCLLHTFYKEKVTSSTERLCYLTE
jgi:hypothetical protein